MYTYVYVFIYMMYIYICIYIYIYMYIKKGLIQYNVKLILDEAYNIQ
jgi:hypothetical protein